MILILSRDQWWQDLRYAVRGLLRARGFALAAVFTLALGLTAAFAMWALVQGVLLSPLPVLDQDRLIVAWKEVRSTGFNHMPFVRQELEALAEGSEVLETVAGVDYNGAWKIVAVENGEAEHIMLSPVTGSFFDVLGVQPVLGRTLRPADDVRGAAPVIVIGYGLWQRRYGGSGDVLGRTLNIREKAFTIVGVAPRGFELPRSAEAWLPVTVIHETLSATPPQFLIDIVARMRPGTTHAQVRSEMQALLRRVDPELRAAGMLGTEGQTPIVHSFQEVIVGDVRSALLILSAAVALVLLIACANVANLLLIRGAARSSEFAVRTALGAARGRLVAQMLAETAVVVFIAAGIAFLVTGSTLHTLVALLPAGLPRSDAVRIDTRVAIAAVAMAAVTTLFAGLVPALSATRDGLLAPLRGGGRGVVGRGRRGRQLLVVTQVALALVVIAAAGLLTRSLLRLQSVDMGLARDRLTFVTLDVPLRIGTDTVRAFHFIDALLERFERVPGVNMATSVNTMPFSGTGGWDIPRFMAEGQDAERAASNPSLNMEAVRPDYFATFGIPLLRGRVFTDADRAGAPPVVIISEDVAARTWPGEDPIGKRVRLGGPETGQPWRTVVGVAAPVRYRRLEEPPPTMYFPGRQIGPFAGGILVLRTERASTGLAATARAIVSEVDADSRVMSVTSMRELLAEPLARPRFSALLIGAFGVAALLLSAVGLYGVMAAYVRQRFAEIGIRMALGAQATHIRGLVLGEGFKLAGAGVLLGLAGAIAGARLLASLLYEANPLDPVSLLGAAALLFGVTLLSCWMPVRRATRVDAVAVLRE